MESDEPTVSWAFVELLDASHQSAMEMQDESHTKTVKIFWRIIIGLLIVILLLVGVIGYFAWMWNQYDTVSYDQDGNGNNVIGDNNRSFYEPENVYTTEEEQE